MFPLTVVNSFLRSNTIIYCANFGVKDFATLCFEVVEIKFS
ncbi:Protein of unknown function [Pyronema omphalodes CBS 100304]|uniref:Uncharacterized protein n=1 Tax=Pyronema omphalodes (strain CBS 100304) TaxID=1076935 RepID=U4LUS5_PYROM|nr:Protein of unknown function [Pyronema omphalodes CBS 100304]